MADKAECGYNEAGVPKLGNALANFYIFIGIVLLTVLFLVLGCIPAILSWLAGEGFVYPFFEDEDEFD